MEDYLWTHYDKEPVNKTECSYILKYAKQDSLIFCLDADTMVKNNYLDKVIKHYKITM